MFGEGGFSVLIRKEKSVLGPKWYQKYFPVWEAQNKTGAVCKTYTFKLKILTFSQGFSLSRIPKGRAQNSVFPIPSSLLKNLNFSSLKSDF